MIDEQRIHLRNSRMVDTTRSYVLYWMQASQRVEHNAALFFAITEANELKKPLMVYFGLTNEFAGATRRHYRFMLEGLAEVAKELSERSIAFSLSTDGVVEGLLPLLEHAACLVVDRGYTHLERQWRTMVDRLVDCAFIEVEANVVVPVETASNKEEYSAATLRRKIEPMLAYFSHEEELRLVTHPARYLHAPSFSNDLSDLDALLAKLPLSTKGGSSLAVRGGQAMARRKLDEFIDQHLDGYANQHNDPSKTYSSNLSPYLHFGQISPMEIYNRIRTIDLSDVPVFLEQLVVRRELAINYVWYNTRYNQYEGIPLWAQATLEEHALDPRPVVYSLDALENAQTHDQYWNAAQTELVKLGTMHNYMRMYWGKKILEWSPTPNVAFTSALYLNNTYQLDGRDPNGYAGVAWCFAKHDRPWVGRPIFGTVRYMNAKGLERKFSMQGYLERIKNA